MRTVAFSVESGRILLEAERHFSSGGSGDSVGMVMALGMIRQALGRIARRAVEIDDPVLIAEMTSLCVITPTTEGP